MFEERERRTESLPSSIHVNRGAGEVGHMPLVGFKVNGKRPCKKGVVTQPQPSLRTLDSLSPCWHAPCLSGPTVTPCWDREQRSYSGAMLCRTPHLWKEFPESQNPPPSMGKDVMGSLCTGGWDPPPVPRVCLPCTQWRPCQPDVRASSSGGHSYHPAPGMM